MKKKSGARTAAFLVLKIVIFLLVILALISLGKRAYSFGYRVFMEDTVSDPPGKKVALTIEDGIRPSELADLLEKKGLIRDAKVFWVQIQLSEYKDRLKGGNYILNTSWKSEEMLAVLAGEEETESETEE